MKRAVVLFVLAAVSVARSAALPPPPERSVAEFSLDNGLVVLCERVPSADLVNFSLLIGSGSAVEGPLAGSGATHLLEHLIFKGGPETALAAVVEGAGGYTNAHTSYDYTMFTATVPHEKWRIVLETLVRAVFAPRFTAADFASEREVVVRELARMEDRPEYHLSRAAWETAFLVHPYRLPIGGYAEVLKRLSFDDLKAHHGRIYVPSNAILAAAGPLDAAEFRAAAVKACAAYPRGAGAAPAVAEEPEQVCPRERSGTFPTKLTQMSFAYHIPRMASRDAPLLDIAAEALGQGNTSRLQRRIVDTGLAYGASSYAYTPKYPGLFLVGAVCLPEKAGEVKKALAAEIERLVAKGISRAEMDEARGAMRSRLLFGLETVDERAEDIATSRFLTGNALYAREYLRAMAGASAADVAAAVRRYLRPDNMTFAMVSPAGGAVPADGGAGVADGAATRVERVGGIPAVVRADAKLPIASFSVLCRGGMLHETPETGGLFPILANMLVAGTRTRTRAAIDTLVASWGGTISPFSGNNSFGVTVSVPSERRREALALLADVALNPSFPEDEIVRVRRETEGGIIGRDERPVSRAATALRKALFGAHPYGLPDGGTKETVARVDRDALARTHRAFVGRGNMVVTAFGDVDPDEALRDIARLFARAGEAAVPPARAVVPPAGPALVRETSERKEAVVMIGYPGIAVADGRRAELDMLSALLNSQDGLLFDRLREKEPLVYASGFSHFVGLQPGMIYFHAQCRPDTVERVTGAIAEIAADLAARPRPGDEIAVLRAKVLGHGRMGRQTIAGRALDAGLSELYGLGFDHSAKVEERVKSVSAGDLQAFARDIFQPGRRVVVVVAPADAPAGPAAGR